MKIIMSCLISAVLALGAFATTAYAEEKTKDGMNVWDVTVTNKSGQVIHAGQGGWELPDVLANGQTRTGNINMPSGTTRTIMYHVHNGEESCIFELSQKDTTGPDGNSVSIAKIVNKGNSSLDCGTKSESPQSVTLIVGAKQ